MRRVVSGLVLCLAVFTSILFCPVTARAETTFSVANDSEFADAVKAINSYSGESTAQYTVNVTEDISPSNVYKFSNPKTETTIIGNGHSITFSNTAYSGSIISAISGAKVNLGAKGGSNNGLTMTQNGTAYVISVEGDGSTVYMYSGVTANHASIGQPGGIVTISDGANFYLDGGVIENGSSQSGAGVSVDGANFYMSSGTIQNCTAGNGSGGAIDVQTKLSGNQKLAEVVISGGTITGCSARYGGGICNLGGNVTISGGEIKNCTGYYYGGGIYSTSRHEAYDVSGSTLSSNVGTLTITGGNIHDNTAANGAGIYYKENGLTISGGSQTSISNNTASYFGGGIHINGCTGTVNINGSFTGNSSTCGGAIYCEDCSDVSITGGSVTNNRATYGGAVYSKGSTVSMTGGSVTGNSATYYGGGVFNETDNTLSVNGAKICNNAANIAADDIFNNIDENGSAGSLTLGSVGTGWTLNSCNHAIDGWYDDGSEGENIVRWNAHDSGKTVHVSEVKAGTYSTQQLIKAAHGTAVTYSLIYDAGDAGDSVKNMPAAPETKTNNEGSASFDYQSSAPTWDKHKFLGWAVKKNGTVGLLKYYSDELYDSSIVVSSTDEDVVIGTDSDGNKTVTLTLAAVWASDNEYILEYNANGGSGEPAEQHQAPEDGKTSVDFTISTTAPTYADHQFLGWADTKDAAAPNYSYNNGSVNPATITLSEENTTNKTKILYAVWIENKDAQRKQGVPTVEKKVWDNGWKDTDTAGVNHKSDEKNIAFRITGTIPNNLKATLDGSPESDSTPVGTTMDVDNLGNEETVMPSSVENGVEGEENDNHSLVSDEDAQELGDEEVNAEEEQAAENNETPAENTETPGSSTPIFSSYTDYKFTDNYGTGITPDFNSLKVYLYYADENAETAAAGLTDQTPVTGENVFDITELFDIDHSTTGTFTVNLKKTNVPATDGSTGIVDLKKSYTLTAGESSGKTVSFNKNCKIVVYYTATLNTSAVIGPDGNPNEARLEFRNRDGEYLYTPYDKVKVFTFDLNLTKYKDSATAGNELSGAKFRLYKDSKSDANLVGTEVTSDGNGKVSFTVDGKAITLAAGTYVLEETNSPSDGYNRMADVTFTITPTVVDPSDDPSIVTVTITSSAVEGEATITISENKTVVGQLINKAGSILPSTGGRGTTVLYLIGLALITTAGAGVVLKKRRVA